MKRRLWLVLLMACALAFLAPARACAHGAEPVGPDNVWQVWRVEADTAITLAALLAVYAIGVLRLWKRAGVNRGIRIWQLIMFMGGWLALSIAQASPLETITGALLTAHMLQHMLLVLIAAPLLTLCGLPIAILFVLPTRGSRAISHAWRRTRLHVSWRRITHPLAAWIIFAGVLWGWHAPALYQAALVNEAIHLFQHISFLAAAALSWWWLLKPGNKGQRYGIAVIFFFTTIVQSSALGALMMFSSQLWYPAYGDAASAWGMTPLQDQQLDGLIMWVPVGLVYTGVAVLCMALWLSAMERRVPASTQTYSSGGTA
jgi:cytochrome c oxidase assembly factor CtaG